MNLVPFIVLGATPEAAAITARVEATHQKLMKAAVLVSDGQTNAIPTKLSFEPGVCTLRMPLQQIAEVKPNQIRFYDEIFNQVATLKNPKPVKVPDYGSDVAIIHRDAITWLLDSNQKKSFFSEMKKDPRWQVAGSSLMLLDTKRNTLSQVRFDNFYRVTEIKVSVGTRVLSDWKYRYLDAGMAVKIPDSAKVVKGLPPHPSFPQKTDGKTVLLAQKVWRALSRLEGRSITEVTEDGTFKMSYGKGIISESGPKGSWTLTGTHMVMTPKSGASKTFDGGSDRMLDNLRSRGIYASPIARYILNRKIPFLDMFDRNDEVKLVDGIGNIDGKSLSVISMKRAGIRIRMYVDLKSGELAMVSSDAKDTAGNVVSGSRLKITYR